MQNKFGNKFAFANILFLSTHNIFFWEIIKDGV